MIKSFDNKNYYNANGSDGYDSVPIQSIVVYELFMILQIFSELVFYFDNYIV